MTVVLAILKWIGIVLLAILALILLILLLVLFVPIRYRVAGTKADKDIRGKAVVSWLLHLVHASVTYEDKKVPLTIRAAGIPVVRKWLLGGPEKPKEEEPAKEEESAGAFSDEDLLGTDEVPALTDTAPEKPAGKGKKEKKKKKKDAAPEEPVKPTEKPPEEKHPFGTLYQPEPEPEKEKKPVTPIMQWVSEKIFWLDEKAEGVSEKADGILTKVGRITDLLDDPHGQKALVLVKRQLIRILKSIAPKRGKATAHVGMPDKPETMGQICMITGILYPFTEKRLTVIPEFEEEVLDADGWLSGRIWLCVIAGCAIRLLISPNVWYCIKQVKKWK